jgi:DNA replication protein DnaD
MTSGWFQLHRGWRDSDVFGSEGPFSEREAWLWLIENAAWKPMTRTNAKGERIRIERGQMHLSLRQLEKVWGWGKNKVSRFLQRLEDYEMISGTASGQSGHIVTLCNYDVYQEDRDSRDSQTGTASGHTRKRDKNFGR